MSKSKIILLCFAVLAFIFSLLPIVKDRVLLLMKWQRGSQVLRDDMLFGKYNPLFEFVNKNISEDSALLLFSDIDPALIPYILYPRRIYQISVEPETDHLYMEVLESHYPPRNPESFKVDWIIKIFRKDAELGMDFWRLKDKKGDTSKPLKDIDLATK